MSKRKALGSGLEALLSTKSEQLSTTHNDVGSEASKNSIVSIPIDKIERNKSQPRKVFFDEALESMAKTLKEHGQLTPIIVRKSTDGYELIAGERRWRAMQSIQSENIDAIVMDASDKDSALIAIVENVQREQLNVIEEAEAFARLNIDHEMTHEDISRYTGRSRPHISNIMRLNSLTDYVKQKLADGAIEMGHARAVLSLPATQQDLITKRAISNKLSVRSVESLARNHGLLNSKSKHQKDQDTVSLENELSEIFGADIIITHNLAGKGKVEIKYKTLNELQGIINRFKKR